ncbi:DMT family transporter [Clostridium uliginosum]|uniref:Transporter family-2 protein n=1 Tax=Clostridium uliginosum TaxID=119641 RepID=A0A1I1MZV1_9CLOT|nr:DMT family transporter [Clostridium uliginosum]SFC90984.1 transporter family-2 protein [Clostridium uliginosum]
MLCISLLTAFLAGVSIVVARIINSSLAEKIGTFQGTFFNFAIGLFFSFIFLLLSNESLYISSVKLQSIPLWSYLGGIAGILVIVLSNYITPKISAFYLTLIIFIGQLFVGIIIDYFTLNELSIGKVIGGFLVLIGLTYNLLIDKNNVLNEC